MATFVLRAGSDDDALAWAYFEAGKDSVHVTALTGAASYIDRNMPCQEARELWAKLKGDGWIVRPLEIANARMPIRRLKMFIYD